VGFFGRRRYVTTEVKGGPRGKTGREWVTIQRKTAGRDVYFGG